MIEERRQNIREYLKYPDDEDPHDDPFPNFLGQRVFHNPPKQQAENGNDDRHDDGGPEHEAFAENQLVHFSTANPPLGRTTDPSYTHSYPAARSRAPGRARWPPSERGSR